MGLRQKVQPCPPYKDVNKKIGRIITNEPWHITNRMLHEERRITTVIHDRTTKHIKKSPCTGSLDNRALTPPGHQNNQTTLVHQRGPSLEEPSLRHF